MIPLSMQIYGTWMHNQVITAWRIWIGLLALAAVCAPAGEGVPRVPLYGMFERQVTNGKPYSNPFDFQVVELQTTFVAPSGRKMSFFGFHDGDGIGGQTGQVWRFRFMPDETGPWHYSYSWTDDTEGGSGSFEVKDTGLEGPLRVAADNPWYFMTARGKPFHARPYGMHHFLVWSPTRRMSTELGSFKEALRAKVIDRGYNMIMWPDMGDRLQRGASSAPGGNTTDSWWFDTTNTQRFSTRTFRANEDALGYCRDHGVYAFNFAGMIDQGRQYYLVNRLRHGCSAASDRQLNAFFADRSGKSERWPTEIRPVPFRRGFLSAPARPRPRPSGTGSVYLRDAV
ncbi:MAG TPA: DUF5060 domain-containing protein [Candidatus Paceibacterota bacterium]|nr:DUF5060 domain-containing protein [Verrucomicrobiota bacterium]HRY49694.1 DUF5060 domain-containing protein [Candidatus Paceibacterota bacterium]